MQEYINSPQKTDAQKDASTHNGKQLLTITDNRPLAIQQRKLQEGMNRIGYVVQCKDVDIEGYRLTIEADGYDSEAVAVFYYLEGKGLLDESQIIHIRKAPGSKEAACHHWAFGGLVPEFKLDIQQIHEKLGFKRGESVFGPSIPGPLLWPSSEDASEYVLDTEGDSTQIRVYEDMDHSSRKENGLWWHKFLDNEFIFAVEGPHPDLIYKKYKEISVKALKSKVTDAGTSFTYKKI